MSTPAITPIHIVLNQSRISSATVRLLTFLVMCSVCSWLIRLLSDIKSSAKGEFKSSIGKSFLISLRSLPSLIAHISVSHYSDIFCAEINQILNLYGSLGSVFHTFDFYLSRGKFVITDDSKIRYVLFAGIFKLRPEAPVREILLAADAS